nr:hypothetical protein [Tanacetum cinerariifolium]
MYKEYLAEFWYSVKTLKNSMVFFSTPTSGIYGEVGVNTFRNAIGAHYLLHSSEYVAPPSIDIVRPWFETIRYGEAVPVKGTLKRVFFLIGGASFVIHSEFASKNDASAASTTEANLGNSAPSDFVPQQQGMNEGTKNTSYDYLFADDPVIVMDDSDEDEDDEVHATKNVETKDTSVPKSSFPMSSQIQELTNQVLILYAQKKIEEEAKAEAARREGEIRNEELIDLLSPEVVNKYYNEKLKYDRYCDKMLNGRAKSRITSCDILTRKGPITLKVYIEDDTSEIIPKFKANDLHLAELGIELDRPLSEQDPLDRLNDLANKKRKHADDIHDFFRANKRLKSSV